MRSLCWSQIQTQTIPSAFHFIFADTQAQAIKESPPNTDMKLALHFLNDKRRGQKEEGERKYRQEKCIGIGLGLRFTAHTALFHSSRSYVQAQQFLSNINGCVISINKIISI